MSQVFEIQRDGVRWGLALSRAQAERDVGREALPEVQIQEIDVPVVFLLIDVETGEVQVCATLTAAVRRRTEDQQIEVAEVLT